MTRADGGERRELYESTQLGAAVLSSALSPDEGLTVFGELQRARRCFVLENELHVIYLVSRRHAPPPRRLSSSSIMILL